ncbi:Sensor histidine kinase RcsC [Neobacillus rhizosphaerae]|uniref:histidine kinase n=1 Tax=Neobacillus rhizosphaerae TaxID=2880965 RepID=A0ABM9EWC2_9BACI|nr:HAMP domain-containing sensor histidine kinase [Neobacillus rhizosphaerae]CAH2716946.1 Sensor histidine kinase RcsC [Neobacillus rhizosphaerae]
MDKQSTSIYARLLSYLLYSLLGAGISTVILAFIIRFIYIYIPLPVEVNYLYANMRAAYGFWYLFFIGTIILTVIYYALAIKNMAAYFKIISRSVDEISEGRLDIEIPIWKHGGLSPLAQNINQMKEQLESLIEDEKKATQSKDELVTNVSHDLRTPLTSIIGYLRLIEEDQYRDEVELRYFVDIAYEKSIRLNRMVNDLFEFTKINNRDLTLKLIPFNLIELLKQLAAQFLPELIKADMEIELKASADELMIEGDPDRIMRAFENLISNAIKYGNAGRKITLVVEAEGGNSVVKVVNYGEAIPTNAIPHIFDRLYRVEQSRSDETGGTGLGLAIAKGIVELHQGEIIVSSNDVETIFQVQLPLPTDH